MKKEIPRTERRCIRAFATGAIRHGVALLLNRPEEWIHFAAWAATVGVFDAEKRKAANVGGLACEAVNDEYLNPEIPDAGHGVDD